MSYQRNGRQFAYCVAALLVIVLIALAGDAAHLWQVPWGKQ